MRDYDPQTNRLYIRRLKRSNAGTHPVVVPAEIKALRAWLKVRGPAPGPIFPSRKHAPISRQQLDVLMKRYGRAASIPPGLCHFHILKHSCGTHLANLGYNVQKIQDWLGHRNISNTMVYVRISNVSREQMAEDLRNTWK